MNWRAMYRRWMKRLLDLVISLTALIIVSPVILTALVATWAYDRRMPLYLARRVGRHGAPFTMYKVRTMAVDAELNGIDSTSATDPRITPIGRVLRRFKIDELPQFINVVRGDMSIVGPRPNVERETRFYTKAEELLLSVRPGITDFSSIVFSDLAEILRSHADPNIAYRQLVRPWKSRFGLFYIAHVSWRLDFTVMILTAISFCSRSLSLRLLQRILEAADADNALVRVAARLDPLVATSPPDCLEPLSYGFLIDVVPNQQSSHAHNALR